MDLKETKEDLVLAARPVHNLHEESIKSAVLYLSPNVRPSAATTSGGEAEGVIAEASSLLMVLERRDFYL